MEGAWPQPHGLGLRLVCTLRSNSTLTHVSMSSKLVNHRSCFFVSPMLAANSTLTELILQTADLPMTEVMAISDAELGSMASCVRRNHSLKCCPSSFDMWEQLLRQPSSKPAQLGSRGKFNGWTVAREGEAAFDAAVSESLHMSDDWWRRRQLVEWWFSLG